MKKEGRIILVLAICLSFAYPALAETIILKSGQKIEGKIIEKTNRYILIQSQGAPARCLVDDIKSIEGDKLDSEKKDSGALDNKKGEAAKEALDRGFAYAEKQKLDEAIAEFNKAIEINPNYVEAYQARSVAYLEKNNLDKVSEEEKLFGKLGLVANPNFNEILMKKFPANNYCLQGTIYLNNKAYDMAIINFNKALEINPNFGMAYLLRGSAYLGKGSAEKKDGLDYHNSVEQSILDFQETIEIFPNHAQGYLGLATAYLALKEIDKEIFYLNKVIELSQESSSNNPNLGKTYKLRAEAYFAKQQFDKAWEDLHKTESLGYKVPEGLLNELKKASRREK